MLIIALKCLICYFSSFHYFIMICDTLYFDLCKTCLLEECNCVSKCENTIAYGHGHYEAELSGEAWFTNRSDVAPKCTHGLRYMYPWKALPTRHNTKTYRGSEESRAVHENGWFDIPSNLAMAMNAIITQYVDSLGEYGLPVPLNIEMRPEVDEN